MFIHDACEIFERPKDWELYPGHSMSTGLSAFYGGWGSGGNLYYDSSPGGIMRRGTLTGFSNPGAAWGTANGRAALSYNGFTNRVDIPYAVNLSTDSWTYSTWYTPTSLRDQIEYLFIAHSGGNTTFGHAITRASSSSSYRLSMSIESSGGESTRPLASDYPVVGVPMHIAVQWTTGAYADMTLVSFFVNGHGVTYATPVNKTGTVVATTGTKSIGGRIYDNNRNVAGKLWDEALWNRWLSAGEIETLASPDPMLGGWLQAVGTLVYSYGTTVGPAGNPRRSLYIGGGIV